MHRYFRSPLGLLVALVGLGCATTVAAARPVSDERAAELNELIDGRKARITLARSGEASARSAKDVTIGPLTTEWLEQIPSAAEWKPRSAQTSNLQRIQIRRRGLGALEGLAFGIALGALAGAAFGASLPSHQEGLGALYFTSPAAFGALVGAGAGGLLGPLIGAAIGHRTTIEFEGGNEEP